MNNNSISLSDLKNDALPEDTAIESDAKEVIDREYVPEVTEPVDTRKPMQVVSAKMDHNSTLTPIDTKQFGKSNKVETDPEQDKIIADLDFAVNRVKARVDKSAAEAEAELHRQVEEGLKAGIIRKKNDGTAVSSETKEESIEDDDIYDDPNADDLEVGTMSVPENKTLIDENEAKVTKAIEDVKAVDDSEFENIISQAQDFLNKESTNEQQDDVAVVEAVEDETPTVENTTTAEIPTPITPTAPDVENLPMTNPAVEFDESEDDPYDDEDDDASDGLTEEETEEDRKAVERFREEVKIKIKPIKKTIDLNNFKIRKKPVKASSILKLNKSSTNISDWVMPSLGRSISLSELSGMEIMKMNPEESGRNRINVMRDMYQIMYEHVQDPNKGSYEEWCKSVVFTDVDHIQFGLFKATFEHSNFIHCTCEKCKNISLIQIPIMDMVEFEDDASKERFQKIFASESVSPIDGYEVNLVQISDQYVFALKMPSVYNVIIEIASLDQNFIDKYGDLVDIVSFIDEIYYIDANAGELVPVSTNPVNGDIRKSCTRKIRIYNDILSSLSSDEYLMLRSKIGDLNNTSVGISYKLPDVVCPKCGNKIEGEHDIQPTRLLFTRHQLGLISNT